MTKGRSSNPPTDQIGNWYKHKNGLEYSSVGSRLDVTSTGSMLSVDSERSQPSVPPPPTFLRRSHTIYSQINPFSYHDNRNDIQLKGEYLGNGKNTRGLGRRLPSDGGSIHRTEVSDFLRHHGREPTDSFFHTNYMLSHTKKSSEPAHMRRFSKEYAEPRSGSVALQTTTTDQFCEKTTSPSHRSTNQTLVSSLEPYIKHNAWKYTYNSHGKHDVYPKAWGDRCSTHLPQFKPKNRSVIVNKIPRDCRTCA